MKYLKAKQKKGRKGKEINYNDQPEMQDYLLPNDLITLEKQRKLFQFRTRMNFLPYNFLSTNSKFNCERLAIKKSQMNTFMIANFVKKIIKMN